MKALKKSPLVSLLSFAAILCLSGAGYHWLSLRNAERSHVAIFYGSLAEAKKRMLSSYAARIRTLEKWGVPTAGAASSEVLKFATQSEADRFEQAQNKISEKISLYLSTGTSKDFLKQIQKVEEAINFDRKDYHRIAFQIRDANQRYRLDGPVPPIFAAERMMKEKGLF